MKKDDVSVAFLRLVDIMNDLREKCPWDKKQTIQSLRQMTIEETFELAMPLRKMTGRESGRNWAICYCILFFIQRSEASKNNLNWMK